MTPARTYPERRDGVRLLAVDPAIGSIAEHRMPALPALLAPGDLVVVNDAATLPASLRGADQAGQPLEIRLLAEKGDGVFSAVLFGAGDWRQRTEDRPSPPPLPAGARLSFGALGARVARVDTLSPRLIDLAFDERGAALWAALYRAGRPVQYSYLAHELPLWAVQNVYASRPWAAEMPSAGRALSWEALLALRQRGIGLASVTHAAGLSATGDPGLDRALPLAERFEIPPAAVAAVEETRARGGRVAAVGTTVVRALEGAIALWGRLRAGTGQTDLRITPGFRPRVVDGLLSGMHGPEENHFALLRAFAPAALLDRAWSRAQESGFLSHELGDAMLVLPS
jgi:S-adenosylmethionine:tRNA ribosyltransferase-isomerase